MRWYVLVILIIAIPFRAEAPSVSEAEKVWLPQSTWQPDLPSHCTCDGNGNEQCDMDEHHRDSKIYCHLTLLSLPIAERSIIGVAILFLTYGPTVKFFYWWRLPFFNFLV